MAYLLKVEGPTAANLAATVQRISDDYYWNPTAVAFQSAPSFTDKRINMTEGASESAGLYSVSIASLGDAGDCRISIHDTDDANKVVATRTTYIEGGEEASDSRTADIILRRAWATASEAGHGDADSGRSLLGLLARHCNRWEMSGTNLIVYKADDTTPYLTIAVGASSAAEPIISMNPPA